MKRYDIGREYLGGGRIGIGAPAITEQAHGAYVRHDDYLALADEWLAEKAALEQIVMTQEVAIAELREGMEAVGAGGVSLMGDAKDVEIARLRSMLKVTAAVGITMLYDSHPSDVVREFSVEELMRISEATSRQSDAGETVEHIYRQAWNAALTQQEQVK